MKEKAKGKKRVVFPTVSLEEAKALLAQKLTGAFGEEIAQRALAGCVQKQTCFRVNTVKAERESILGECCALGLTPQPFSFYSEGFSLAKGSEETLSQTTAYQSGGIYLQNASSFLPALLLSAKAGEDVLDACAAPGGKTGMIYALSGGKVNLTACEKNAVRAEKLKNTVEKQGVRATVLIEDALNLSPYLRFDRILLDAPCSGSGTLDFADARTCKNFSEGLIQSVKTTQKKLIKKVFSLLKKGGTMVYSTCSILPEENDEIVKELLAGGEASLLPIEEERIKDLPKLPSMPQTLCVCPTNVYEGFYVAVLKKEK